MCSCDFETGCDETIPTLQLIPQDKEARESNSTFARYSNYMFMYLFFAPAVLARLVRVTLGEAAQQAREGDLKNGAARDQRRQEKK